MFGPRHYASDVAKELVKGLREGGIALEPGMIAEEPYPDLLFDALPESRLSPHVQHLLKDITELPPEQREELLDCLLGKQSHGKL